MNYSTAKNNISPRLPQTASDYYDYAKHYLFEDDKAALPRKNRLPYYKVEEYLNRMKDPALKSFRLMILPGLRGVGKSVILAQIYNTFRSSTDQIYYYPLDKLLYTICESNEERAFLTVENMVKWTLENRGLELLKLESKVFFLFDEVQIDLNWAKTIRALSEINNLYFLCTGSSAYSFKRITSPDTHRRSHIIEIYPLRFTEYLSIIHKIVIPRQIHAQFIDALGSSNPIQKIRNLKINLRIIDKKMETLGNEERQKDILNRYLDYYSLPYIFNESEDMIHEKIFEVIERIVHEDIAPHYSHIHSTVFIDVLKILAEDTLISYESLSKTLGEINKKYMKNLQILRKEIVPALVDAGIIYAFSECNGSKKQQTSILQKIIFRAPVMRKSIVAVMNLTIPKHKIVGCLREDLLGMYLLQDFEHLSGHTISFDDKDGADFILTTNNSRIAFEIGSGSKDFSQVSKTIERNKADYGITISDGEYRTSEDGKSIHLPFSLFCNL